MTTRKELPLSSDIRKKLEQLKDVMENGKPFSPQKSPSPQETGRKKTDLTNKKIKTSSPIQKQETKNQEPQKKSKWQKRQQQLQKIYPVIDWLTQTYPNCFDKEHPKPLCQGIHKDLFANLLPEGPFAKILFRKALAFYTRSPQYIDCLIEQSHRVDLSGNPVHEIDPSHKEAARAQREIYRQRREKQKQFFNKKKEEKAQDTSSLEVRRGQETPPVDCTSPLESC